MSYFNKGVLQVIALFVLCMIADLLITVYIQREEDMKQWLVIATCIFIIELFVIVNSLKIRKVLILNFGILPDHSDDHFSSAYKEGRKKAEAKGKKEKESVSKFV